MNKKIVKKIISYVLVAVMLCSSVIFSDITSNAAAKTVIKVTNLPANVLAMKKGTKFTLKVKATTNGVKSAVTYSTSNKKIVTVTSAGKLKAIKNGKATITIKSKVNKKVTKKIDVTVGTPVTKVSLNLSKKDLAPKDKVTLKATISPKKPSIGGVVWTSSNPKVAKVSSKGVVTALKLGKAKITATAKDGSGKKAVCSISVVKPVKVVKINMINTNCAKITLNRAYRISKDNIKLQANTGGSYSDSVSLTSISTSDNRIYTLKLRTITYSGAITGSEVHYISKIKASIINVPGGKSSVAGTAISDSTALYTYTKDNSIYAYLAGDKIYEEINVLNVNAMNGMFTVSSKGLPEGIECVQVSNKIIFRGSCTKAGKYNSSVKFVDEWGQVYEKSVIWLIGNSDVAVAGSTPLTVQSEDGEPVSVSSKVYMIGHNYIGSYTAEIIGESYGLELKKDVSSFSGHEWRLTGSLAPGSYKVKVGINGDDGTHIETICVFNVEKLNKVTISLRNSAGVKLPTENMIAAYDSYPSIRAYKLKDSTHYEKKYSFQYNKVAGTDYTCGLPDGTYKLQYSYSGGYSETATLVVDGKDISIKKTIKIYEIKVNMPQDISALNSYWTTEDGVKFGNKNASVLTIIAVEGQYRFILPVKKTVTTATGDKGEVTYEAYIDIDLKKDCTVTPKFRRIG